MTGKSPPTNDEIDYGEKIKELEEDIAARTMLTLACMTELTAIVLTILVKENLCSPDSIRHVLTHFRADLTPNDQDSPEGRLGKELLGQGLDLLVKRIDETKQGQVLASIDPKNPPQ